MKFLGGLFGLILDDSQYVINITNVCNNILTWTVVHTHDCSESSGLMDGDVFHEWFQTSCVQIVGSVDENVPYLQT